LCSLEQEGGAAVPIVGKLCHQNFVIKVWHSLDEVMLDDQCVHGVQPFLAHGVTGESLSF
jgi:hypothetical protein